MFDDQPNQAPGAGGVGAPPSNLPIGEPEDMFAGAETTTSQPSSPSSPPLPSAVDAGMLKPKMMAEPMVHTPPPAEMMQSMEHIKEPKTAKRIMIIILILIGVAVLVGIIWIIFGRVTRFMTPTLGSEPAQSSPAVIPEAEEVETAEPPADNTIPADEAILFGEPIDADGDNLNQSREQTIGTDPNNWDTDGDGLNDGDEVIIWKTDPLNTDTDGDTFSDGSEVTNGYSPTGPGKLFQPPGGA